MATATCCRCGRVVPDDDHIAYDGRAYHERCLPRKAREGYEPEPKKLPFTVRFYRRLESLAETNKVTPLETILRALAVEFNTSAGYLKYVVQQLQDAGCVERKFDLLTLIKEPQVGAPQEESAP